MFQVGGGEAGDAARCQVVPAQGVEQQSLQLLEGHPATAAHSNHEAAGPVHHYVLFPKDLLQRLFLAIDHVQIIRNDQGGIARGGRQLFWIGTPDDIFG